MPEGTATAAAEPTRASLGRRDADRPYAPSWLDLVFDWLAGLPGPTWLAYLILAVLSVILSYGALWLSGLLRAGQLDPAQVLGGTSVVVFLAAAHHFRNVAGSSFDAFRPALGNGVADAERARYELTVMPARPVLVLTILNFVQTPVWYATDPVTAQVVGVTGAGLLVRYVVDSLTSTIILMFLLQAVRQMRQVARLHAAADNVDPFRPEPLYAFSRLTAQAGIVILIITVAFAAGTTVAASESTFTLYLPVQVAFFASAIAVFVVPLLGMHRRLEALRGRLQGESAERLKSVLGELNRDVDGLDLQRADALNKMLASLLLQRDVLARLPTWPWSTGTIRGFGSALLLPIALFLIQRYLGQLLG